jgi:predicted cupin superfamily sugar epimerase
LIPFLAEAPPKSSASSICIRIQRAAFSARLFVIRRGMRGAGLSPLIYYLLDAGQVSRWHKVDAAEVWHYYAGAALEIKISQTGVETGVHRLGPDLIAGERPQYVVPAHCWQSAKSVGAWTLVGCSVAPGFEFSGFELAPFHWSPAKTG